jgi:hypothetical protein
MRICPKLLLLLFEVLSIALYCSVGFSAEGLEWGRFRVLPELSVSESYTDNVYLDNSDIRNDYITDVAPKLSLDFAFATRNYLTLRYEGEFRNYKNSDNFKKDIHRIGVSWTWNTPKDSLIKLGARADFDSIQPFSVNTRHKDFEEKEVFGDTTFNIGASTDIGVRYSHTIRRFNDPAQVIDDFDEDKITFNATYTKFLVTEPIIEYTFSHQDNKQITDPFRDMNVQMLLIGVQWRPSGKLTGFFKPGYFQAKSQGGNNSNGFAMNVNMTYQATDVMQFKINASRNPVKSTMANRETGNYFISTVGNISADYKGWAPVMVNATVLYRNNNFKQQDIIPGPRRTDNYFSTGLSARYSISNWLSFSASYHYNRNNSNLESEIYKENRGEVCLSYVL